METMAKAKLIMTVEEAEKDHNKWVELRNTGLGGSDAGVVMGVNPYKSRLTLWMEKTGQKEADDLSEVEAVQWGIRNEPNIADWFSDVTGKKLRKCGTLRSEQHPWLLANVDRMVVGENAGLEIKTAGVKQSGRWRGEEVPDEYYCQCQHYMLVTGCDKWYIAVLIGGNKAIWKEIPRNESFIGELFNKEAGFWTLVENKIMPSVDGLEDTKNSLNILFPKAVPDKFIELESTEKLEQLFHDYEEYKNSIKTLGLLMTEIENKIKVLVGDNELALIGDHKVRWSNYPGRVTVDAKRLAKDHPDIYAKYKKVVKDSRRFSMN